jgi:hypothetical protein
MTLKRLASFLFVAVLLEQFSEIATKEQIR